MKLKKTYPMINQMMSKYFVLKILCCLSLSAMLGCSTVEKYSTPATYPASEYNKENDLDVAEFLTFFEKNNTPEQFKTKCDEHKSSKNCYLYAAYQDLIIKDYYQAYHYFKRAYELGNKKAGAYVAEYQMNKPELFNETEKLSIDETIFYLEQAYEAGSKNASALLLVVYREPEFNRMNLKKSEYYNKIAIKQNVKRARFLLATLYTHAIKDKSKIDESIALLQEDLRFEGNWESAIALMNIYLYPEDFGAKFEPDLVKTLAYAYVSSDLRDGRHEGEFNKVDTRFVEAMEQELPSKTLQQAQALYKEIMAEINETSIYEVQPNTMDTDVLPLIETTY